MFLKVIAFVDAPSRDKGKKERTRKKNGQEKEIGKTKEREKERKK